MRTKTVTTGELRKNIAKYLRLVTRRKAVVEITRYHRAIAWIIPSSRKPR